MNGVVRKAIAVVVACFLLLSLLAACNQKSGDNGSSTTTKGSENTTQAATTQTEKVKEKVTFTWVWQDRKAASAGDEEVRQYINEKFNVDFKTIFIAGSELQEKMAVMIAAGDTIDCTYGFFNSPTRVTDVEKLRESNQIQSLDSYLKEYGKNLLKDIPEDIWSFAKDESGKTWFIPDVGFASKHFLFVRKDWMEKLNITAPKTIDEFEKMLVAFRDGDLDGNNKKDTYPMAAEKYQNLFDCFLASFTANGYSWFEKDGQLVPYFMDPDYKLFLSTMRKWYAEGLIHPDIVIIKSAQAVDLASKGISGVFPNYYSLSYQDQVREAIPGADMTYIDWPVGPSGKGGAMSRQVFSGGLVISSKVKPEVAERIVEIVDWFQTPEGTNFVWYGIEGRHWVKNGNIIESAPGIDPTKPAYNAQLLINGGNAWKYFTESALVRPPLMSETRQAALSGKVPSFNDVDYQFPYVWAGTKSEPLVSDLSKTMPEDMFIRILTGEKPVDWLDEWLQDWIKAGGDTYIKEKTEQYFKLKPLYGKK